MHDHMAVALPPGMIAVAATDMMWTVAASSLIGAILQAPKGSTLQVQHIGTTIAEKRYRCVVAFLENPALEWILFHDSDMLMPADTVRRLLSHRVDVVSAVYVERNRRHNGRPFPSAGHVDDKGLLHPVEQIDGSLQRVDVVGAGCLLIRRSVFSRVAKPWFRCNEHGVNEDWDFCNSAVAAGIGIYVDTGIEAGHMAGRVLTLKGERFV